ncbi:MAG: MFS transporter, partial [Bacteroidales bacterium]|nr:MFS transporter [Bacteroidales bacterium]
ILTILKNIYIALKDFKFLVFLIIIVGFWTMYNQLFYTLPVFIEQWVDTTVVYDALASISPGLANAIGTDRGTIAPEMMTNIDAGYIVLFQLLISTLVMRFKPLNAMISGIFIAGIGLGLTFMTQNGLYLIVTILVFAVGEMASSPKIIEYIGKIAPKDKVALYMGCSFLPMAGGNFFAGILSGDVYEAVAGKMTLLKKEVAARGLDVPKISEDFTQNDYIHAAAEKMGMTTTELTNHLWVTYHPGNIWIIFTGIGVATAIALLAYDRLWLNRKRAA